MNARVPVVIVGETDNDGQVVKWRVFVSGLLLYRGDDVYQTLFYFMSAFYVFHLNTSYATLADEPLTKVQAGPRKNQLVPVKPTIKLTLYFWSGMFLCLQNGLSNEVSPGEKKSANSLGNPIDMKTCP